MFWNEEGSRPQGLWSTIISIEENEDTIFRVNIIEGNIHVLVSSLVRWFRHQDPTTALASIAKASSEGIEEEILIKIFHSCATVN